MPTVPFVTVTLPPALRPFAKGHKRVRLRGKTVGEVLDTLAREFPSIRTRLIGDNGDVRRFVNIYIDDVDVRTLQGRATPVRTGSDMTILSAVAGG
ncbi:MoaD/ThiS family protein [Nocardia arthritidis]|uniref:Molybdopterin synthase sulfur carrier subunit n=1 Tax=Nocardia arthritidis TaxID=228602 RepID=A0A6G9YIN8_9NOCA|nr:MoaD/ThiS family protein [Nocardia arthritidis]QIS13058.1 molybdopterin synthase sulfur carrier subunit [Nocardia arthritidis]